MKKTDLLRSKALLKAFKKLYLLGFITEAQVDHLYINLLIKNKNIHVGEYQIKRTDMEWRRDIPAAELARRQTRLGLLE